MLNQSILAFEWNCFQFLSCFGKDGNKCLLNGHQTTMTAKSFPPQSIAILAKKICCKLNTLQNVQAAAHQYLHNNLCSRQWIWCSSNLGTKSKQVSFESTLGTKFRFEIKSTLKDDHRNNRNTESYLPVIIWNTGSYQIHVTWAESLLGYIKIAWQKIKNDLFLFVEHIFVIFDSICIGWI